MSSKRLFAANPSSLDIIENPTKPRNNMAKSTTEKAVSEFKQQAVTAGYILGGQAIGAQGNALIVPKLLGSSSATVQQIARAALPLGTGVAITLFSKNSHLRGLAMGMGVQGIMEVIKFVMPDWTPQQGLMEGSDYVWTQADMDRMMAKSADMKQLPMKNMDMKSGTSSEETVEVETDFNDMIEV